MEFKCTIGRWKDEQKPLFHFWWVVFHFWCEHLHCIRVFIYNSLIHSVILPSAIIKTYLMPCEFLQKKKQNKILAKDLLGEKGVLLFKHKSLVQQELSRLSFISSLSQVLLSRTDFPVVASDDLKPPWRGTLHYHSNCALFASSQYLLTPKKGQDPQSAGVDCPDVSNCLSEGLWQMPAGSEPCSLCLFPKRAH